MELWALVAATDGILDSIVQGLCKAKLQRMLPAESTQDLTRCKASRLARLHERRSVLQRR